jgi:acetylornithine deacetylase/succinyl-diaminopimelate desuccinylase-like protein
MHLEEQAPKGCTVKVTLQDTGNPFLTPIDHSIIQKAAEAYEQVYGKAPFIKEKGAPFRLYRISAIP